MRPIGLYMWQVHYRPQTKFREGNVFTGVYLYIGGGISGPMSFLGVGISGTKSLPGGKGSVCPGVGMLGSGWVCLGVGMLGVGGYVWGGRLGMFGGGVCPRGGCPHSWTWDLKEVVGTHPPGHGTWDTMGCGWQAGGMHPTGMLSCSKCKRWR